jgi:hypothetical protein
MCPTKPPPTHPCLAVSPPGMPHQPGAMRSPARWRINGGAHRHMEIITASMNTTESMGMTDAMDHTLRPGCAAYSISLTDRCPIKKGSSPPAGLRTQVNERLMATRSESFRATMLLPIAVMRGLVPRTHAVPPIFSQTDGRGWPEQVRPRRQNQPIRNLDSEP